MGNTGSADRQSSTPLTQLTLRRLADEEDATAFRRLNEEWISRHFTLEPADTEVLGNPLATIVNNGGRILIAARGTQRVGCVALKPLGNGVFELSKMAVSPEERGRGIGRRLLEFAIAEARAMGARRLFLGSSTKLANAVHLYEAYGFVHVPAEDLPPMPYARADVFMELPL